MNYFDNYFMKPIIGILSKKGAIPTMTPPNPMTLHSFSRGNAGFRRLAGYHRPTRPIIRSRAMGGY